MNELMSWPTKAGWHTPYGTSSCVTRRRLRVDHQLLYARRAELSSQFLCSTWKTLQSVCAGCTVPYRSNSS